MKIPQIRGIRKNPEIVATPRRSAMPLRCPQLKFTPRYRPMKKTPLCQIQKPVGTRVLQHNILINNYLWR